MRPLCLLCRADSPPQFYQSVVARHIPSTSVDVAIENATHYKYFVLEVYGYHLTRDTLRPFVPACPPARRKKKRGKGPIWTLKFNVHGTRMATAGQDGKVIIWDVAVPPRGGSPATAAEGAADVTDTSNSSGGVSRRRGRNSTATLPSPGEGTAAVDVGGASYQGAGAKSAAAVAVKHAPEGGAGREEAYLDTESTSTALSDDGSRGRGSSELGLAGGDRDGKEQGFAGSEVRDGRAGRARKTPSGRFCFAVQQLWGTAVLDRKYYRDRLHCC